MKGEHCELISIAECLTQIASETSNYVHEHDSRFAIGSYKPNVKEFRAHVKTEFLSPQITYTVNLVLKNMDPDEGYIGLEYKLAGGRSKCYSFLSDERDDGWLSVELFQFTSENKKFDLKILFYIKHCRNIIVEGIEFRPLEKVVHEVLNSEIENLQLITDDSETFWEQKLPKDYKDIVEWSNYAVRYATKKELYSVLRKGFLINNGEKWISLAKDGKKCLMLSARATLDDNDTWSWKSLPETRFEVAYDPSERFNIICQIESRHLSPETTYAGYLVYKQENNYKVQPPPARVKDKKSRSREICYIYLSSPQTPVIITRTGNHTHCPMNRPKIKGLPQQRSDGWMEVQIWEFCTTTKTIDMHLKLSSYDNTFEGIEVQGIELRPK
uniref:putative F-box protein PP2-B8 n=1 Tax=Erigeron canadensis TaxID=72917 RepID=UPI001CB94C8E|nr:putative F-box protein PP2-B8 [Erigeron canadensis]